MEFNISIDSNPFESLVVSTSDSSDISSAINLDNKKIAKIFSLDGDKIIPTAYLRYILAAQAKASFARWIVDNDKDRAYSSIKMTPVPDPAAYEEFMAKEQRAKNEAYQHEYDIQRDLHKDWFEEQESVENIAEYCSPFITSDQIYIPSGIEAIVDAYKFANSYLKDFKDKDKLPKTVKRVVSKEYKSEWSAIADKLKKEYDYKTKAEVEAILLSNGKTIEEAKSRLNLNRRPPEDTSQLNPFCKSFVSFLLNRDFS